ncbi:MAG TPA: MOSC N-terminal beta barrel domain-containing protein [Rudaea sp.]|nr:MOSC N-terminal beta barrel domain-containing protein [Rudaea sp.]
MTVLASIHIYPLKSGAPLALDQAVVEKRGLARDRRWMLVDANGKFVTGRQLPRLTMIRAQPLENGLRLSAPGMPDIDLAAPTTGTRIESAVWGAPVKPLLADDAAHAWISTYLRAPHRLVHMDDACTRPMKAKYDGRYGNDDDEVSFADGFPLLLISQAALDQLNEKLAAPVPMLRFRPNLVVAGTAPHAEDGWKRIRIGTIEMEVLKPCVRCVFTTVQFEHGTFDPSGEPLRTLLKYRRGADGVTFGQNLIPRGRGTLRLGDPVEVLA